MDPKELCKGAGQLPKVLCVGIACIDFINVVKNYPVEDSDERGVAYYWQRGGNATNTATVLSVLSVPCELMTVFPTIGPEARWMRDDCVSWGIDISHCAEKACSCAISTCILSESSGSRTIIHYPGDYQRLTYTDFWESFKGEFLEYSWIHFELAVNIEDFASMLDDVLKYNTKMQAAQPNSFVPVVVSIEVEKPEIVNAESLVGRADCVFVSKDFAQSRGCHSSDETLQYFYQFCKDSCVLVSAWGDQGSAACCGKVKVSIPALTDIKAVDTLGAGDTFNAAFIRQAQNLQLLSRPAEQRTGVLEGVLKFANTLAGRKCEIRGYKGLEKFVSE